MVTEATQPGQAQAGLATPGPGALWLLRGPAPSFPLRGPFVWARKQPVRDGISASAPQPGKGRPGERGCARRDFGGMRAQGLQRRHSKGEILPPTSGYRTRIRSSPAAHLGRSSGKNAELIAASRPEPRLLPGAGGHPARRTLGRTRGIRGTSGVRPAQSPSPSWCPQSDTVSQQERALGPRRVGTGRVMGKGPGQVSVPSGLSLAAPRLLLPQEKQKKSSQTPKQTTFIPYQRWSSLAEKAWPAALGAWRPRAGV